MAKCSSSIQEALGSMPSIAKFIRQLFLVDLKIEKPRRKQSFEVERSAQQPSDKAMELSYHRRSGREAAWPLTGRWLPRRVLVSSLSSIKKKKSKSRMLKNQH